MWIARAPGAFAAWCTRPPIVVVERLFYLFKAVQAAVFLIWCWVFGEGSLWPTNRNLPVLVIAVGMILIGQVLSTAVFVRLGRVGVFYGDRFGHEVPWCRAFPFTLLAHPQYAGALMTIWGVFAIMRFPHDDWSVVPLLETVFYTAGTWWETRRGSAKRDDERLRAVHGHFDRPRVHGTDLGEPWPRLERRLVDE